MYDGKVELVQDNNSTWVTGVVPASTENSYSKGSGKINKSVAAVQAHENELFPNATTPKLMIDAPDGKVKMTLNQSWMSQMKSKFKLSQKKQSVEN